MPTTWASFRLTATIARSSSSSFLLVGSGDTRFSASNFVQFMFTADQKNPPFSQHRSEEMMPVGDLCRELVGRIPREVDLAAQSFLQGMQGKRQVCAGHVADDDQV